MQSRQPLLAIIPIYAHTVRSLARSRPRALVAEQAVAVGFRDWVFPGFPAGG